MRYNQPQNGPAAIDRSNPITKGLVAAFLPGSNGLLRDSVSGNAFDTSSGAFATSPNRAGRGIKNAARNTQSAPDPGAKYANASYTYLMIVDMVDTGATYAGLYCRSTSGASAASLQNSPAGAGKFDVYHSGSPAYTTTAGTGFVSYLLTGGLCVMLVAYNDSDRSIRFYLNGALIESGTCSASPTPGDGRLILFGERGETNTYGMQGTCSGMFLWNRALSDAEAKNVTANYKYAPWQIFKPAQRFIFAGTTGGTNTPINPAVGVLALTGYGPTVAQSVNQALTPAAGSLTLTGYAPSVAQSSAAAVNPGAGSLVLTGYAPTITQPQSVAPGAGSLSITGFAPSVAQGITTTIAPGAGSLAFAGYAPSVAQSANQSAGPLPGTLAITGYAPALAQTANQAVLPAVGALAITGYAPSVAQAAASPSLTPGAGVLSIIGYAPSVVQAAPITKIGGDDVPRDEDERIEIWEPRKPQPKRDDSLDKVVREAYAKATGKPIDAAVAKLGPSVRAPAAEPFDQDEDDFEVLLLSY